MRFFYVSLSLFLTLLGSYFLMPFSLSQQQEVSCDSLCVGMIQTLRSLSSLLFALLMGYLSDIYGRKRLLLCGMTFSIFSFLLSRQKMTIETLTLSSILSSLNQNVAISKALYSDYFQEMKIENSLKIKYMGYIGSVAGFSFMIGPFLGSQIASSTQEAANYSILMSLISIGIIIFLIQEPKVKREEKREEKNHLISHSLFPSSFSVLSFTSPSLATILLVIRFLMGIAYGIFNTSFNLTLFERFHFQPQDFGSYYSWIGFSYLLSQSFLGQSCITSFISDPSATSSSILSFCCLSLSFSRLLAVYSSSLSLSLSPSSCSLDPFPISVSISHSLLYLTIFIVNLSLGIINILLSQAVTHATDHYTGTLYGTLEAMEKVSGLIGPFVGGYLHQRDPYYPVWIVGGIYLFIAILVRQNGKMFPVLQMTQTTQTPSIKQKDS